MNRERAGAFDREIAALPDIVPARISGRVTRVVGLIAESHGLSVPVGSQCEIVDRRGKRVMAEVVGFRDENTIVIPYGEIRGISAGDRIFYLGDVPRVWAGTDLVGRVLDSSGQPIDQTFLPSSGRESKVESSSLFQKMVRKSVPIHGTPINPMLRRRIDSTMATGIRVIDGLFSVGRGQRMGIFAGSGVGKSVLLSMIARNSVADVSVIALIGERGREVREFVERDLGPEGLKRSVVIVATSDEPPLRRVQAALIATAIAEFFRDQGKEVMFLLDSITRVAMAQREIGLSAGEPPATKGYPPSVFTMLPSLLERSGPGLEAAITAFYTVLVEGDDIHDPIGDSVRGILDGHLWLSRDLAGRSFFPAVDPLQSISRSMTNVVSPDHEADARKVIEMISRYREIEDLIQLGAYSPGADSRVDAAVTAMPTVEKFLRQSRSEFSAFEDTVVQLESCVCASNQNGKRKLERVPTSTIAGGGA